MTTKPSLELASKLSSYNILIISLSILFAISLALYGYNRDGFNKTFGYEIFAVMPLLFLVMFVIREFLFMSSDPSHSWLLQINMFRKYNNGTESGSRMLNGIIIAIIFTLILGIFFAILGIGGVFSKNPPENNTAVLINCLVLFGFILVSSAIYFRSAQKDSTILPKLDPAMRNIYMLRTRYTTFFVAFIILVALLYFLNPWGVMTNAGGPIIFFSLFIGIVMVLMIRLYQNFLEGGSNYDVLKDYPTFFSLLVKGFYVIVALVVSGLLIYGLLKVLGVLNQDSSDPATWGHIIFNIFIFCVMLSVIYRLMFAGGFLEGSPYYRLFVNTLLYIPCLLVYFFYGLAKLFGFTTDSETVPPTKKEVKILLITLLLLGTYFCWIFLAKPYLQSNYLIQGGKQLINQPISTTVLTNVASYQQLNDTDARNYQFAMSYWFYLDAFPPSTSASYSKIVPILSYGQNPTVKYCSNDNTIYITVNQSEQRDDPDWDLTKSIPAEKWEQAKKKIPTDMYNKLVEKKDEVTKKLEKVADIDGEGHRIIYRHSDVLLQKWNHIVLNFNGGTLDVFYNGKLVKSAIEVVPYQYLDMLTVGTENGVSGSIANLIYFKQPLDIVTIQTLYNSLKDKNPPALDDNNKRLIPLPNNI